MKKKTNTYLTIAEAINDFSFHRLNKAELYEILVTCVMESTNADKEIYSVTPYSLQNEYTIAKNWLLRRGD